MKQRFIKAFDLEYLRDSLARDGKLREFKNTYRKGNPEIPNINSGKMWDHLNKDIRKQDNPMAHDRVKSLIKYIKSGDINILDYGFGQGALEEELYKRKEHINLIGIDISRNSVNKAKKRFKKWKFIEGSLLNNIDIYTPQNFFDYIVCSEVLEHISPSNTFSLLEKFYKSLKRNGFLLLSIPLNEGLEELIRKGKNPNAHSRIYTEEIIKKELIISGFKFIKSEFLYAFHKYYFLKKIVTNLVLKKIKKPNIIIIFSQKP